MYASWSGNVDAVRILLAAGEMKPCAQQQLHNPS